MILSITSKRVLSNVGSSDEHKEYIQNKHKEVKSE